MRRIEHISLSSYLVPMPDKTPVVKKSTPTCCVPNPLRIWPKDSVKMPSSAVALAPNNLITLALTRARMAIHAKVKDPIQERVEGEERPCSRRAACITPQL